MEELTDYKERIHKVNMALLHKMLDDAKQKAKLDEHLRFIRVAEHHHLPFKVVKDYFERIQSEPGYNYSNLTHNGKVILNPYYPLIGANKDDVLEFEQVKYCSDKCYTIGADGKRLYSLGGGDDLTYLNEQAREQARARVEELRPYNYNDADGFIIWQQYYLHFLVGYDFSKFSLLDMYGHKNKSLEELQADIKHFTELQEEYTKNPSKYFKDEPTANLENLEQYTHNLFYWDFHLKTNNFPIV